MIYHSKAPTLARWLSDHAGEVVQIGTKDGSGFLYAGKAGRFTLDAMRSAYKTDFSTAKVYEVRRSFYAGYIVIIHGSRSGLAELPRELIPKFPGAPIENYIRFADNWAGVMARDYKQSLLAVGLGTGTPQDESNILQCEKFIRSNTFALIVPHADGEQVITLIKKQVRKEIEEREQRRKERSKRWIY